MSRCMIAYCKYKKSMFSINNKKMIETFFCFNNFLYLVFTVYSNEMITISFRITALKRKSSAVFENVN